MQFHGAASQDKSDFSHGQENARDDIEVNAFAGADLNKSAGQSQTQALAQQAKFQNFPIKAGNMFANKQPTL